MHRVLDTRSSADRWALPEKVFGFAGLAFWLSLVGVQRSAKALCKQAERQEFLPVRRNRSGVYFRPADLRVWVHHLTGVDWDLWEADQARERQRARARQLATPSRARAYPARDQASWPMYGVLERLPDGEERIVHRRDGVVLFSGDRKRLRRAMAKIKRDRLVFVRYAEVRVATASDFKPGRGTEHRLLAAMRMYGGKLQWIRLRGVLPGFSREAPVSVALSRVPSNFGEIQRAVQAECPSAIWFTWIEREILADPDADPPRNPRSHRVRALSRPSQSESHD